MLKHPTIFYTRMLLFQIMRDRMGLELYQNDITPNHGGEGGVRAMS
jgi:hypothetical protein